VNPYGKSTYLSAKEAGKLLNSINRDSIKGKRDYLLILGYLILGRRNSEWRTIKWSDIQRRGDAFIYIWSGKGKTNQKSDFPPIVSNALLEYKNSLPEVGEFVFTSIRDNKYPLSMRWVSKILDKYCRVCGIGHVKVHTLRHTAAMLRKEAGDSLEEIMNQLGHSTLAITQIYLHSIEAKKDSSWNKVSELLGIYDESK